MKLLSLLPLAALTLGALAAATPSPDESKYDQALQAELLAILESDQAGRVKIDELIRTNPSAPGTSELWQKQLADDAANQVKIGAILDQRGWVGPDLVGPKASSALFFVVQHADLAMQKKYLPLLRTAVQQGQASGKELAMMEDRAALAEGRRQLYGTQLFSKPGDTRWQVRPIEDPDHVDERRAAVGLPPMSEYLKHFNLTWDLEAFKKEMPNVEQRWVLTTMLNPANYDQDLRKRLLAINAEVEAVRSEYGGLAKKFGAKSPEVTALIKRISETSAGHVPEITTLLDQRGWVGVDKVGIDGEDTIIRVLQEADQTTRRKYLPLMRAAVKEGKTPLVMTTWFEDTVALADTGRQIYGTQVRTDSEGKSTLQPIDDPAHVDERRAAAGLPPMAEHLKNWNLAWDAATFAAVQPEPK